MVSVLFRFRHGIQIDKLEEYVREEFPWRNELREIRILDDETLKQAENKDDIIRYLCVKIRGGVRFVEIGSICFLEKAGRSIEIHMKDGTKHSFYGKFEDVLPMLGKAFCQCHKSYVVNLKRVEGMQRYAFYMKDGGLLPVSQKKYQAVKEYVSNYLDMERCLEKNLSIIEK